MMARRSGVGASDSMLASSVTSSSSSYSSESLYFSALSPSLVWGRVPLPTVAGSLVGVDMVAGEGKGECFLVPPIIVRISSCDRASGLPSVICSVPTTCARVTCVYLVLTKISDHVALVDFDQGVLAHHQGDCETTCCADSILEGTILFQSTIILM